MAFSFFNRFARQFRGAMERVRVSRALSPITPIGSTTAEPSSDRDPTEERPVYLPPEIAQDVPPLWLDRPDALDRLQRSNAPEEMKTTARELILDGFTVIRGAIDPALCDQVIADYGEYSRQNRSYVDENLDVNGREKRLVNFHHWSDAEMQIGCNARIMNTLDFIFDREACVYTSLTFKYGTQQPIHRDTPHFATWPDSYFVGVWTALEDVDPQAGPLQYHPGGHRFDVDQHAIIERVEIDFPDLPRAEQLALALDIYNGQIIERSPREGRGLEVSPLRKGDTAIWHAQLPHGGYPVGNPDLSRWSVVFHCAPSDVQVYQHDTFFSHRGPGLAPIRYGFEERRGRRVALAGGVAFM